MKKFEMHVAYLVLAFAIYYVGFSLIPFNWYVDVTKLEFQDMCVGSDTVTVHTHRVPQWGMEGDVWSQVVLYENDLRLETTIHRKSDRPDGRVAFAYESDRTEVNYDVRFDQPIETPGLYGLSEWVNIYPLPFIKVKKYIPAEDTQFNVIECN